MSKLTLETWIDRSPDLTAEDRAELKAAIASRGKNKGKLRSSKPASGKAGALAYQAIMAELCPARFSVFGAIMFSEAERAIFDRLSLWCERNKLALIVLGSHPFQFSLWDYHNDRESAYRLLEAIAADGFHRGETYKRTIAELEAEREAKREAIRNEGRA